MRCASDKSTDGNHLHRRIAWGRRGDHDHRGDTAVSSKRQSFDHLLVGDDLVISRWQRPIDAINPERVLERDSFPSRACGHRPTHSEDGFGPVRVLSIGERCALSHQLASVFSRIYGAGEIKSSRCIVFGLFRCHLKHASTIALECRGASRPELASARFGRSAISRTVQL